MSAVTSKAVAAAAARAADPDGNAAGAGAGAVDRTGDVEAARAAAAAQRLGDDAARIVAQRRSGDQEIGRNGDVAIDVDRDVVGVAAEPARAADPDIDRAGALAGKRDAGRDVEPASAAAAADRLGQHAVAVVAAGIGRAADADIDRAGAFRRRRPNRRCRH